MSTSLASEVAPDPWPQISVAIPVRDEEQSLAGVLEALLGQSHPPREIVVADGGSTDGTVALARAYSHRGVRVLELGPALPGRGRNLAIAAAKHDWVALIDAGCIADRDWLEALLRSLSATGGTARAILGNYRPRILTAWDEAQALAIVPPLDPYTGCRPPFIASSLLHRSAWRAAGGFPEDLRAAEDLIFFRRLEAAGVPMTRSPQAFVEWSLAEGPRQFFRRLRLYSRDHLASGLYRTWHLRVMLMDFAAVALVATALAWPPAALGWVGLTAARLFRTVSLRRGNVDRSSPFRPGGLARVAALLCLADLATWAGAVDRLTKRTGR